MNKREVVELESAFLAFVNKVEELGFEFKNTSESIELHHPTESPNCMSGRVTLVIRDFLEEN